MDILFINLQKTIRIIKKSALFFLILFVTINSANAQEKSLYSYGPDGKVEYQLSKSKIVVKFKDNFSYSQQAQVVKGLSLLKPLTREMLLPSPKVSILEFVTDNISYEKIESMLSILNANENVEYANPFLVYQDGTLQGVTNQFFVKLKSEADLPELLLEAKNNNVRIKSQYQYDPLLYFVTVDKSSNGNALAMANKFAETRKFAAAEPDFLLFLKKYNTNDTFLNYQWSLNNTGSSIQYSGTPGADMRVFNAWGITTGSSSIKVAIIDEGVDLVHPDLVANLLPGFDGTGQGSAGAPSGNDAHGTACAGIVAGVGNNNLGVAGVAYNCKIVPVRIAYSSAGSWVTSNSWIGTSLDWAWNQGGADVLSNSWGGGSSSTLINDPITRATTQGRGGLGSPVLFAAGNSNTAVAYPATLSNVISVTALSMCNQRKSPTSCDGETFWGSNYGVNGDISAPGVKIYTCDISGAAGYSTGDYTATFNGTSSATPNSSGVMALILSTNPALTQAQARLIIESTCDKVGGYTYNSGVANQPNGTWSNDLGYGKVNAYAACQLASPTPCVNPPAVATTNVSPSSLCLPGNVYLSLSGINLGSGQTYQWQSSPNNTTYTNISNATGFSLSTTVSSTTWFRCVITCGVSTNSTPVQVVFNDPTISTFPYTQNFDASSALPCGWTVSDVNNDGSTWATGITNPRSTPNNMTYSYSATNAANDWLFTAPLSLTAGQNYRIRFWYRVRSATYPEKLEVKWGSSASAAGMTSTAIFSNSNLTNTTYAEAVSSFISPGSTGIYYIGLRAFSAANMYDLNIDDVTIEVLASCGTPLLGGTISGASTMVAGTASTYTLSGNTGTGIQWQQSTNGGGSWSDISGATAATLSFNTNPGSVQLRAKSFGGSCADVFSNVLTITVNQRVGDTQANPIICTLPYTTSISNATGSGFTSTYTGANQQASPDVFFRFTTGPCTDSIKVSSCGSSFDTYVHLLNASGTNLSSNDDNGPYCTGTSGSLKFLVSPNTTYFAVAEGYSTATGTIALLISEIDNPTFSVSISAGGPTTFNQGGSVLLSSSLPSNNIWSPNGQTTQSISATVSGTYSVTNTNANGCTAVSNSIVVTVIPTVTPSITITQDASSPCAGTVFSSSITNGGTTPSYQWKKNNVDISGANSSSYQASGLTNGDIISCVLTSNHPQANPTTATSNSINVNISFATTTWNGTVNSLASNAANWSNGIPSKEKNVIISGSALNPCSLDMNLACNNLSIQSSGVLTMTNNVALEIYGNLANGGTLNCTAGDVKFLDCAGLMDAIHNVSNNGTNGVNNFNNIELNTNLGLTLNTNAALSNTLTLTKGTFTNNNQSFTLKSNAVNTARISAINPGANFSGNITMERFVPGGLTGWALIGSPVYNQTINNWMDDFSTSGFTGATGSAMGFVSMYTYDESVSGNNQNGYVPPTNATNSIIPGKGYMAYIGTGYTNTNNITIDLTGPINVGNVTIPVSYTASTPTELTAYDGWNLIANPYPSAIDWDSPNWAKSKVNGAIYLYNADIQQYATYVAGSNGVGINGGSNIIASSQGFWVKTNGASPILTATEQVKASGNPSYLRTGTTMANGFLKLKLIANNNTDETIFRQNDFASINFDQEFDASKFYSNNPLYPNIASKLNGDVYAVNTINNADELMELPIEIKVSQTGTIQLQTQGISSFSNTMYLKDNNTGVLTLLEADTTLNLMVEDTVSIRNQYSIVFNSDITVNTHIRNKQKVFCYPNPAMDLLMISAGSNELTEICVYNSLGEKMLCKHYKNAVDVSMLAAGIYYINARGADGTSVLMEKFIKN